jgi:hypothetical protein
MANLQANAQSWDTIPVQPFHKKIGYGAMAAAVKALLVAPESISRNIKAYFITPPPTAPDIVKTYPVRPRLPVR